MQENDFLWIKGRIDDLAKKWAEDKARDFANFRTLRNALEAIQKVQQDDKGNHFEVIQSIADDALRSLDC